MPTEIGFQIAMARTFDCQVQGAETGDRPGQRSASKGRLQLALQLQKQVLLLADRRQPGDASDQLAAGCNSGCGIAENGCGIETVYDVAHSDCPIGEDRKDCGGALYLPH